LRLAEPSITVGLLPRLRLRAKERLPLTKE
jgi:hypothetical protein